MISQEKIVFEDRKKNILCRKIKILLVDDHPLVRVGLLTELKRNNDFKVVADASNACEAISKAEKYKPDIILLDISLPDVSGLEVIDILREKVPLSKVIALTMHKSISYVKEMRERGARGYVLKDSSPEFLEKAIYEAIHSDKFFFPYKTFISKNMTMDVLSKREKEVLQLITTGITNKQIAEKLFISKRTAEAHRDRIKRKLNISNVADLIKYALEMELHPE